VIRFIPPSILLYTTGLALLVGTASAQSKPQAPLTGIDWSQYEVIIYDAATIARINTPVETTPVITPQTVAPTLPQTPEPEKPAAIIPSQPVQTASLEDQTAQVAAPLPVTTEVSTVENAPTAPIAQRDVSALISHRNAKGVPVIVGAPDCSADELAIRMNITKIKKQKGMLVIDLHDDNPEHFLKSSKVVLRVRQDVTGTDMNVCMPVESAGQYAIGIYHDSNNNEKFDKNFLGIPKEHFGASNNPKFGLSKPELSGSIFDVTETGADIAIRLFKASDIL